MLRSVVLRSALAAAFLLSAARSQGASAPSPAPGPNVPPVDSGGNPEFASVWNYMLGVGN